MTETKSSETKGVSGADERLKKAPLLTQIMRKPELGSIAGLILVCVFFMFTADSSMFSLAGLMNFMTPASQLGILALGAALLMIGGEFDLSLGSMIAFTGLIFAFCIMNLGFPLIVAVIITLVLAAGLGAINGQIVLRTGLPSFIVTLAFLFIFRGLTLVGLKWASGGTTQLRGVREAVQGTWYASLFQGDAFASFFAWLAAHDLIAKFKTGKPKVEGIPIEILWFMALAVLAAWVLLRTRVGNWIFASGGDAEAARNSGVPVQAVKTGLFMTTAVAAAIVAILTTLDAGSIDARRGFQKEFEAIIAAVIGGCLLSGGYGSTVGAFVGAIIFGMVAIGLTYTPIDQDWYLVFLGGMLLIAVLFNNTIRKRATGER